MLEKITNALEELKKHYPKFGDLTINEFKVDNNTKFENNILYAPTINHALFYLTHYVNKRDVDLNNNFKTFGTMIDLSRNSVFTVQYMKSVILKKALLGVNSIMLYLEDVYYVEDEPYFGYMRGRYTKEEITEIVDYANIFNIEIIPCIQTLGHFGQFLRWGHNSKYKDLPTVILARDEGTYQLIKKMIKSVKESFKTNKIHIGLDETFGLGFGAFYKRNGYVPQYDIFIEHLNKVNELCLTNGFDEVMIWSDMFFRISSKKEEYYDLTVDIKQKYIDAIPKNIKLVYWDYYNYNEKIVDTMIKKHKKFNNDIVMASGTWIWTKLVYDKVQTDKTAKVHIDKSIDNKINEIYFTQWNDDGSPANYETSFLGLYEMAVYSLIKDKKINEDVFEFIQGYSYDEALLISKLNESPIQTLPLLWDDPLNGIYLNNETAKNNELIDKTIKFFEDYENELNVNYESFDFKHNKIISKLLKNKLIIRKNLLEKYHNNESLLSIIPTLKLAINEAEELLNSYRYMWLSRNKAFGLDVIQSRLSSLQYRFKETIKRIENYENKIIKAIDELDEKAGPAQQIRMNHMNVAYSSVHILSY